MGHYIDLTASAATTVESISIDTYINGSDSTETSSYNKDYVIGKIVVLTTFPAILLFGTIGNLLSFIVM